MFFIATVLYNRLGLFKLLISSQLVQFSNITGKKVNIEPILKQERIM